MIRRSYTMSRRSYILLATLVAGMAASACRSGEPPSPFQRRSNRPIRVEVENQNFLDVTVFATGGGGTLRLGDVVGKQSGRFTIDPRRFSLISGLRLRVDPIGSTRNYLSNLVFPTAGTTVVLVVANELDLSRVILR